MKPPGKNNGETKRHISKVHKSVILNSLTLWLMSFIWYSALPMVHVDLIDIFDANKYVH